MPRQLITSSLERAERAAPPVMAAALVYSARVLAVFDPDQAVRVLERGISVAQQLPSGEREALLFSAVTQAAIVSPAHALRLLPEWAGVPFGSPLPQAMANMLSHGRVADVAEYLQHPMPDQEYPFHAVGEAMGRCGDDETRRRILRGAISEIRAAARTSRELPSFHSSQFRAIFSRFWFVLPPGEAADVVHDVVHRLLAAPDRMTHASVGQGVRFSSSREHGLFEILGPLQHMDPSLAQSLAAEYSQFAKAAARFPYGMESIVEAANLQARAEARPHDDLTTGEPDFIVVGDRLVPMPEAIATAFGAAFERAAVLYAADTATDNPNPAPRERWPSTWAFRGILHKAGQHQGRIAAKYLDRIPDDDIRLLAAIELAAALAGLPELGGCTISPPARRPARHDPVDSEAPAGEAEALAALARRRPREQRPARKPALPPSPDVRITPSTRTIEDGPAGGAGPDFWTMENVPLKAVLSRICDVSETAIALPAALEASRHDFHLVLPHEVDEATMKRLMRRGIEKHFGASLNHESQSKSVYVLTAPHGVSAATAGGGFGLGGLSSGSVSWTTSREIDDPIDLVERFDLELAQVLDLHVLEPDRPATPEEARRRAMSAFSRHMMPRSTGATLTGISQAMTMTDLAELLERSLDRPVIDETGLTEEYALNVETDAKSTLEFLAELCRTTGLVVTPGYREVPMLVLAQHH